MNFVIETKGKTIRVKESGLNNNLLIQLREFLYKKIKEGYKIFWVLENVEIEILDGAFLRWKG